MQGLIIAIKALAAHKLRTVLAILGVFLGTLVLTAVTHIGSSILQQADDEVQKLGPNLVQVRAGHIRFSRTATATNTLGRTTTISFDDALAVRNSVPQVLDMAMFLQTGKRVRAEHTQTSGQVVGVTPSYGQVRSLEFLSGRFVTAQDELDLAMVCVLGSSLAERLFTEPARAQGRDIYIGNGLFKVVGVLEAKGADFGGTSFDEQVFVPLATYQRRIVNTTSLSGFYLNLYDGSDTEAVKRVITRILRTRHRLDAEERDDFRVFAAEDAAKLQNDVLDLVTSLGGLSALISFAVGGLGIFSIMILLVKARQLEIGVRRAVGASRKVIIRQFLTEAGIMAGVGGVLGVLLGLLLVTGVYGLAGLPFVYEPLFCILAALASVLVGVVAGAWPARQASLVEVVTALKDWE